MAVTASQVVATIPIAQTLTTVSGTVGTGLGTIIAAPGSAVEVIGYDVQLQLWAGTAAVTTYLKAGSVAVRSLYAASAGDGLIFVPPPGAELHFGANTPVVLDVSSGTVAYTLRYGTAAI